MNARLRPMVETHKLALLDWLRSRYSYGQGVPSDRDITRRLGLRSTDDALALVKALEADGKIAVEQTGNTRHVTLRNPPPLAGARPLTSEMVEAAKLAVPPSPTEPAAVRGKPPPIVIRPTRPLYVPAVISSAPIAAPIPALPAPPKPEEPAMREVVQPAPAETGRQNIRLNCTPTDLRTIDRLAAEAGLTRPAWALTIIRAHLADLGASAPTEGKPRLTARVLRIASADKRGFWPSISMMIELGATALAAQQEKRA